MGICECGDMTRPPTMDHTRTMKVEVAACSCSDIQDSTKESTEQDSSDDFDFYLLRVTHIFPSLLWMQQCTEPSSSEGDQEASKAFKLHEYN
jgi:hypothetical protein